MVCGWCGGWVELAFVENKKQLRKHKKKEEKTRKTIYSLNSEKTMKTSFYCYRSILYLNVFNLYLDVYLL